MDGPYDVVLKSVGFTFYIKHLQNVDYWMAYFKKTLDMIIEYQ